MVKAKKTKLIHLTKTKKKGVTLKKDLMQKVRDWIDQFDNIFVLQFGKQVKTTRIQQIREEWKPNGRFSFGKNKVLTVALGKKPDDEYHQNLHLLSADIRGDVCLLFTSQSEAEIRKYLSKVNDEELTITLQSLWQKDGTYKSFRKENKNKQPAPASNGEEDDEEMDD